MDDLVEYVVAHTVRGECKCGRCIDAGDKADPTGHTVDMVFFKVALEGTADVEEFRKLTGEHRGDFLTVNPFDGVEHGYMELGAWIGDQGIAMQYMGLGVLLGVFKLMSPVMIGFKGQEALNIAGMGLLSIQAK